MGVSLQNKNHFYIPITRAVLKKIHINRINIEEAYAQKRLILNSNAYKGGNEREKNNNSHLHIFPIFFVFSSLFSDNIFLRC